MLRILLTQEYVITEALQELRLLVLKPSRHFQNNCNDTIDFDSVDILQLVVPDAFFPMLLNDTLISSIEGCL